MRKFPSSLDTFAKVGTSYTFLIFIFLLVSAYFSLSASDNSTQRIFWGIVLSFVIGLIVVLYFYRIQSYSLSDGVLIINRPIKKLSVEIKFEDIVSIEALHNKGKGWIRVMGNGGLWGYWGTYSSNNLGEVKVYCSNWKNLIVITLSSGKKIIISPDNSDLLNYLPKNKA